MASHEAMPNSFPHVYRRQRDTHRRAEVFLKVYYNERRFIRFIVRHDFNSPVIVQAYHRERVSSTSGVLQMMTMETGNDQLIRATFSDRPPSSDGGVSSSDNRAPFTIKKKKDLHF